MEIKEITREDLWKSIEAHYEREDYTESIRDAIYHMCDLIRDKSGLSDSDGTTLIEKAFMGNNPTILVNKNETKTEKDVQQGVAFALKGIIQSIRNPMSHEKKEFTQKEAVSIILYIDYLLNMIDRSGGKTKIDNIKELLFDECFTETERYAELLLREIPPKKRYDLLLEIFYERDELPQYKLKNFLNVLFCSLSKAEKEEFNRIVSTNLLKCRDDFELRMYCHYFMNFTYEFIDELSRLRMEDLFNKSITAGKVEHTANGTASNKEGSLGTWITDKLYMLSNKESIIDQLFWKIEGEFASEKYVFEYFPQYLLDYFEGDDPRDWNINVIKKCLLRGDEMVYEWLDNVFFFGNERLYELFGKEYEECKKIIEENNDLPF